MIKKIIFPTPSFYLVLAFLFLFSCQNNEKTLIFNPKQNSRILFLGNTFAEQLQHHNYFETLIYQSFPERNLTVRNMAWSADEVNLQPRPLDFPTLTDQLSQYQPDIILAFFGTNEAFKGPDSLENFKQQLSVYLQQLTVYPFQTKKNPEIILFSPLPHVEMGGFLPDPSTHQKNLELYTQGMKEVAEGLDIPFVNLIKSTSQIFKDQGKALTHNGIHLTDQGYKEVSKLLACALNFPERSLGDSESKMLREAIHRKNQHFFYSFRTQNGEYIYGSRKDWEGGQTLPSELGKLDTLIAKMDTLIWASAQGKNTNSSPIPYQPARTVEQNHQPPSIDQFILQEGYEIELFASELDFPIANPVTLTFDPQGRMWVASMPSYPHYTPGSIPNDKIVILEDIDRDGKADTHTVFADSLYLPLGFELGDGGVYLTQAPDFVFLKDTDGDGKADFRKNLLHGFGTEDAHHAISAYTWGPDGALYMHEGTFLHSQVETPYGPVRGAYGNTWRYEPRTMKLEPYVSYPYANPWGNVFMRNGTHLIGDVSTGMNYFATPLTVATEYPRKHVEMRDFLTSDIKPKTCGHEIISSRHFPESAQGNILFNTFVGFQGIRQHKLSEKGSGIIAEEIEPLLQSKDLNFRPVDLQFGPDGALYVVDWYNPIIQHGEQGFRESERDHSHGRIWRITYKNNALLTPVDLTILSIKELLDQLKTYEDRVRYRARIQLREFKSEDVLPILEEWIKNLNSNDPEYEQHLLEGLWVFQQYHQPNEQLLDDLLKAKSKDVRAAASRVLFYWKDDIRNVEQKLILMTKDSAPRVRVEAIAALSHFKTVSTVEALLNAATLPYDYYIDYSLKEAFKHLKPVWMSMIQENHEYLANQPDKVRLLFSSNETVDMPGFVKTNPDWKQYAGNSLSPAELKMLSQSPAIRDFLNEQERQRDSVRLGDNNFMNKKSEKLPLEDTSEKKRIELATLPGKMQFDLQTIEVAMGQSVEIQFSNPDDMPHNLLILKLGSLEEVGEMADQMAKTPDGYERNFIPKTDLVLFATPLISSSQSYSLSFVAPNQAGDYPFACTFPGHWRTMNGIMKVR